MDDSKGWWLGRNFGSIKDDGGFNIGWAHAALAEQALTQGLTVYENSLQGIGLKTTEQLLGVFTDLGCKVIAESPIWRGQTGARYNLVWPTGALYLWFSDGDIEARLVTTDEIFFKKAQVILEEAIGPKASAGKVYVLMTTEEGVRLQSIGAAAVPLERDNYNSEVLEDFDAVVRDLKSSDPSGRLAILDGEPGTGKTYLIRGLLDAVQDALFVLVPVGMVSRLAEPDMISALLEIRRNKGNMPTVIILEDADNCLGVRDESNVNAVSSLLNLGDGILGSLMDLRITCTTNLKNDELDEAITRPGRLSRKVHVQHLDRPVAEKLYLKLTGKAVKIDEKLTLAQVYMLARDNGWKPVEKRRAMGFVVDEGDPDLDEMIAQGLRLD